jgi:hypothetical protein
MLPPPFITGLLPKKYRLCRIGTGRCDGYLEIAAGGGFSPARTKGKNDFTLRTIRKGGRNPWKILPGKM